MFNRKIKAKDTDNVTMSYSPTKIDFSIDLLEKMRNNQEITNYEFMMLAMQQKIIEKLTSMDINLARIDISTQFTGKFISNKFKSF